MAIDRRSSFGEQLRVRRLAAHLTQEELAERAGLTAKAVSALERGERRHPYPHTLSLLGDALGWSPEERAALKAAVPARNLASPFTPAVVTPPPLPLPATALLGREHEVAEARALLHGAEARLLTLTGPGGCGKTRLALQVAAEELDCFGQDVWLVELAALADPALVPSAVAMTLGVRERPGQPVIESLRQALGTERLLLVLDNCEHVLDACARLADALLRGCPGLRILATSREALGIPGEFSRRVPPLATPDPAHLPPIDALIDYAAIRLFAERAREVQAEFALLERNAADVALVCSRLDGLPLAIELAAVRVRALSVDQILTRLQDRFRFLTGGSRAAPRRQRTLQATIDWSHDLLSDAEQRLFRRLAVFAGGLTLEAAEAVTSGEEMAAADVLDPLTGLVDKSLVQAEGTETAARYRLLETVRQYAQEKLLEAGEGAALRGRHAAYYLALAVQDTARLHGEGYAAWVRRRLHEEDNLRAALAWYLENADAERALRLGAALLAVWPYRGQLGEVRTLVAALLGVTEGPGLAEARAQFLSAAAVFAYVQGDYLAARTWYEQNVATWRQREDRRRLARTLLYLGLPTREQGDYDAAQAALEEALALAGELDDPGTVLAATLRLGEVAQARGDFPRAQLLYEQTLAMDGAAGEDSAWAAQHLGRLFLDRGNVAPARTWLGRGLLTHPTVLHPWARKAGLALAAALAAAEGRPERALRLAGAVARLLEAHGFVLEPTERRSYGPWLDAAREELGEVAAARAEAVGRAMPEEQAVAEALAASP